MSKSIRDTILELVQDDLQIYSIVGRVVSISGGFAEIEPLDGSANLLDVRVVADSASSPVAMPLVNSIVICTFLDNDNAFISQISEVDKYKIANTSENLKDLITDLISAITQATWNTPAGPTVAPPLNLSEFQSIVNRVNNLFD